MASASNEYKKYKLVREQLAAEPSRFGGMVRPYCDLAEDFWGSAAYFPILTSVAATSIFTDADLMGMLLMVGTAIVMLLFCGDLFAAMYPLLIGFMMGTAFYDDLGVLMPYWWMAVLLLLSMGAHVRIYGLKRSVGKTASGLIAVTAATILGGLGTIPMDQYVSPVSMYYVLGLGAGMLLTYLLVKASVRRPRSYDLVKRFAAILYASGIFMGMLVLRFYLDHWVEFSASFSAIYFSYRNYAATMILIALPATSLFVQENKLHLFSLVFQYLMLLLTGSRSGLILGTTLLIVCLAYIYRQNKAAYIPYRKWILLCLLPVAAVVAVLARSLFEARMVDGMLISMEDSRITFFIQAMKDFAANPLFGIGLGNMKNSQIFLGVPGSMVWYHNYLAQIIGSMGMIGLLAYGVMLKQRFDILWATRNTPIAVLGLSYLAMLALSMVNPGEFCPFPDEMLMVVLFAMLEDGYEKGNFIRLRKQNKVSDRRNSPTKALLLAAYQQKEI